MKQGTKTFIRALIKEIVSSQKKRKEKTINNPAIIKDKRFFYILNYHELVPFLYPILRYYNLPAASEMKEFYYYHLAKYIVLEEEFLILSRKLQAVGIGFVPLKGFSYAHKFYKRFGFRPLTDIDILIRKKDIERTSGLLRKMGYYADFSEGSPSYWLKNQCHLEFVKIKGETIILVELHWALDFKREGFYPLNNVWQNLTEDEIKGLKIKTLTLEDTLLSLALHQRRFGRMLNLKYVCDAYFLIKQNEFNWPYTINTASKNKMRASLYFLLKEMEIALDTNLAKITKQLKINFWQRMVIDKIIKHYIFSPPQERGIYWLYLICHFVLYDNFWYPLKYLLNIPQEQFAKYLQLDLYTKKALILYKIRFIYLPYYAAKELIGKIIKAVL